MSRRPPSQRDPAFANSRAAKVVSQLVPGRHRTTNAAPLPFKTSTKARGLVPQPPAPAAGAGPAFVYDVGTTYTFSYDDTISYAANTSRPIVWDTPSSTPPWSMALGSYGGTSRGVIQFNEPGLYQVEFLIEILVDTGVAPVFGLDIEDGGGNAAYQQSLPYLNDATYQVVHHNLMIPCDSGTLDNYLELSIYPIGTAVVPYAGHSHTDATLNGTAYITKVLAAA